MFHAWACLLPALVALMVPAVAAWRLERRERGKAVRDGALAFGALLINLFPLALLSGAPFGSALKVAGFMLGFGAFVAGVFVLLVGCRARPAAAQAVVGIVTAILLSSVFVAAPAIESAPMARKAAVAELLVQVNPYVVVAGDALEEDVLHSPRLYATSLADYVRGYPSWRNVAAAYLILGLFLAGIGFGVHRAVGA